MKNLLGSLAALFVIPAFAEENPLLVALRSADQARILAMQSPDREKLDAIFSEDLRYAHSNGMVDTKASFIDILTSGKTRYVGFDYEDQDISFPAPGIALMAGRARIRAESEVGSVDTVMSFLAVWREEKGKWRFLAWQSCKLPPPTPVSR